MSRVVAITPFAVLPSSLLLRCALKGIYGLLKHLKGLSTETLDPEHLLHPPNTAISGLPATVA